MISVSLMVVLCAALGGAAADPAVSNVDEIVRQSVANNDRNWRAAPQFDFTEQDIVSKGGRRTSRTYEVVMLDGSPYNKTTAVNGHPLSDADRRKQDELARRELQRRQHETADQRRKRIARYERERRQDHALMQEMGKAFTFTLAGREKVDGRDCFRVKAEPRLGYIPRSRDTKVLTGMRGTMWIDSTAYQWVRVTAEVFRPVAFGLFIAHVQPGTEFTLEEGPVNGNIWLPTRLRTQVKANVLFWSRNSDTDERYSNYHAAARP